MTAVITPSPKINHIKQLFEIARTRDSHSEEIFRFNNVTWEQFEELLELLPEQRGILLRYLEGELEIMAPSRNHEHIKKILGILVECYFFEKRISFFPLGSTTLRKLERERGIEPDECYCFERDQEFPDLVIEVIFTRGSLDLLEIYKALNVTEVWFWKKEQLYFFYLEQNEYKEIESSTFLPEIVKEDLVKLLLSTDSVLDIRDAFKRMINA